MFMSNANKAGTVAVLASDDGFSQGSNASSCYSSK